LSETPAVDLIFLWHHHQPDYRGPHDGRGLLPWVRLHATKDYLDMALRLERHPGLRATFNFVPTLLDQLESGLTTADALMELIARPVGGLAPAERAELAARCVLAPRHALQRWPRFRALCDRANATRHDPSAPALSDAELAALEAWFLLAWIDPMFHDEPEARQALDEPGPLTEAHGDALLLLQARLAARVIPAYRALAERGQIELSESAYCHPILPLLVDVASARRAKPDLRLPALPFACPEDATRQIERAIARHAQVFGSRPQGMWPPEGSVSPEVAEIAARLGLRWLASDESVLARSRPAQPPRGDPRYRPWAVSTPAGDVALFFRDHELSDRIGFVYQRWSVEEAVSDFLARLRRIGREQRGDGPPVVSVILDGENCWEYYANDGGPFLDALYAALEAAPDIRTRTPSQVLAERGTLPRLEALHTGSWIDADFHIWIGHPEKNRAWDLLARSRRVLVEAGVTAASHPEAWHAIDAAEGSDWFWWLGEDHYTSDKALFERIFREHLQAAFERSGRPVPGWLQVPILGVRAPREVWEQPLGFLHPQIDGRLSDFYEWYAAGRHRVDSGSATHRSRRWVSEVHFGFDATALYLRLDFTAHRPPEPGLDLVLELLAPNSRRLAVRGLARGRRAVTWDMDGRAGAPVEGAECALGSVLELGVPFVALGLAPGEAVELVLVLLRGGEPVESIPGDDAVRFTVPDAGYEASMWSA